MLIAGAADYPSQNYNPERHQPCVGMLFVALVQDTD
jgi:hypothetical protein